MCQVLHLGQDNHQYRHRREDEGAESTSAKDLEVLVCCVQLWRPRHKKNVDLLNQVQRRPQKWSSGRSNSHKNTVCSV